MRRLTALLGARGPKRKSKRRRPRPWLRPAIVVGCTAAVMLVAAASITWAWRSGRVAAVARDAQQRLIGATADAGFTLGEVYTEGRRHTDRRAIEAALGVTLGQPMIALDPAAMRRRLERLGWIRSASVERRWPDALYIRLVEHRPLAVWQRKGKLALINQRGEVIVGADPGKFRGLPMLVGAGAPARGRALFDVMASEPALMRRVAAAVRIGKRRWNLRLDNGIDVRLPAKGIDDAWRRLVRYEREYRLLSRDVIAVDLRQPDRVIVLPRATAPTARRGGQT